MALLLILGGLALLYAGYRIGQNVAHARSVLDNMPLPPEEPKAIKTRNGKEWGE